MSLFEKKLFLLFIMFRDNQRANISLWELGIVNGNWGFKQKVGSAVVPDLLKSYVVDMVEFLVILIGSELDEEWLKGR